MVFSSAPGTGASVMATGLHIRRENTKFFIEASIESAEIGKQLILNLWSASGLHEYRLDIINDKIYALILHNWN